MFSCLISILILLCNTFLGPQLQKGKQVQVIPLMGRVWKLSFDLTLYGKIDKWGSIVHFTIGANYGKYGDRIPAIWTNPGDTRLHIASAVSGNINYYINTENMPLNKKIRVEVEQTYADKKYMYIITIDGKQIHSVENKDARQFENVKVYIANPWDEPANAFIDNFKFENQGGYL